MELQFVKFSDERRKEFCIKTVIVKDGENLRVWKEPIFPEGKEHIENIIKNAGLLRRYYDCEICDAKNTEGKVEFTYVNGTTLEKKYCEALNDNDIKEFEKLLDLHKKLMLGKDNVTEFSPGEKFAEVFGDGEKMTGKPALKYCNYDMIAGNILFVDDRIVNIDYEWVFDFNVPVDYVLYHCIQNLYEHYPEYEKIYPLSNALEYIGVNTDMNILEGAYRSFYDYVISDGKEDGYALMKAICLKNTDTVDNVSHEAIVNKCECDRLQGVIDDLNRQVFDKTVILEDVRNELDRVAKEALIKQEELKNEYSILKQKYDKTIRGKVSKLRNGS